MLEHFGDVWEMRDLDAICITTNGFVKKNGEAVMGAGIAKQVAIRHPEFPAVLGKAIKSRGNVVTEFFFKGETYFSFPVKHNWYEKADLQLIVRSAHQLIKRMDENIQLFQRVALPRPGCGNGKLDWKDVSFVIEPILDNRVIVVDY